jgi:regulator of protease activity HflC (stomatin/prohibitin superfamily)
VKIKAFIGGIAFVAIVILLTLFGSFYTVSEGNRAVLTRNGAVIGEAGPGLHFKLPFIDGATEMSVKSNRWAWENLGAYSRDIQQASVNMSLTVRLKPDAVLTMYSTVGQDYAATLLNGAVPQALKEVFGQYGAANIISSREVVAKEITEKLTAAVASRGLVIELVQIENIDFSEAYEAASEATAKAQAEVLKAKQDLERTKVDAQKRVAEAEADAQATKTRADADSYAKRANGEAEAAALEARAKAIANNPALIDLLTAEKWNGVLPTTQVPGSSVPFVNVK